MLTSVRDSGRNCAPLGRVTTMPSPTATIVLAAAASTIVAVGLGIVVTRPSGAQFLPLSRTLVNIGQTFPPVAVLAVTVPLVGFGEKPTLIALFAYGLLPIFENTITDRKSVPPQVLEAASGMGMSAGERLRSVELPQIGRAHV